MALLDLACLAASTTTNSTWLQMVRYGRAQTGRASLFNSAFAIFAALLIYADIISDANSCAVMHRMCTIPDVCKLNIATHSNRRCKLCRHSCHTFDIGSGNCFYDYLQIWWCARGDSNGENIVLRIAFKPTATISRNQKTVGRAGVDMELRARGRHDPCVVPRAVPMVEAMVALVLADHLLQHFAQCELLPRQDSISPDTSIAHQFKRKDSSLQEAAASH